MTTWILISSIIDEGCYVFVAASKLIQSLRFPYIMLCFAVVWRNLIVFVHNLIIFVLIAIYADIGITANIIYLVPALALICLNGLWITTFLGLLCLRYRDVKQIVTSVLQITMFCTPILWSIDRLGPKAQFYVQFNPFYHFVAIVREPLLEQAPTLYNWLFVGGFTVIGWGVTLLFYGTFKRRIPFWL